MKRIETIPVIWVFWGTAALLFFTGDFTSGILAERGYMFVSTMVYFSGYCLGNLFFLLVGFVVLTRKESLFTRTMQQWTGHDRWERIAQFEGEMIIVCVIAGLLFGLWSII